MIVPSIIVVICSNAAAFTLSVNYLKSQRKETEISNSNVSTLLVKLKFVKIKHDVEVNIIFK